MKNENVFKKLRRKLFMAEKIQAGIAMLKVIESWGVDHIYGYPGGSINSTMDSLQKNKTILNTSKFDMNKSGHLQQQLTPN